MNPVFLFISVSFVCSVAKNSVAVSVYFRRDYKVIRIPLHKFEKLVRAVCKRFKISNTTVDIAIVRNNQIRKLNSRFLKRKTVTDCLSFNLSDADNKQKLFALIVNGEKAKSEASRRGHSAQAEIALYIVHGLLHNLGFDDRSAAQAKKMHLLEDEILRQHGFGSVYGKKVKKNRRLKKC